MLPHEQIEVPVVRRPLGQVLLVESDEPVEEVGLADPVGPRDGEGHFLGRVDTSFRKTPEPDELVVRAEPQLEARRAHAETVEWLQVHASCLPGAASGLRHR